MPTIGIFFGSDTGNTEAVATLIQQELARQPGAPVAPLHDIYRSTKADLERFDILLFGIPTCYYGEPQSDWDDFLPTVAEVDFTGKRVALFGCGDQENYAEYFCDAMGPLREVVESRGGTIVGHWPTAGYRFKASLGLVDADHFIGLAIDQDRQPELTRGRVAAWVKQISEELGEIGCGN